MPLAYSPHMRIMKKTKTNDETNKNLNKKRITNNKDRTEMSKPKN